MFSSSQFLVDFNWNYSNTNGNSSEFYLIIIYLTAAIAEKTNLNKIFSTLNVEKDSKSS